MPTSSVIELCDEIRPLNTARDVGVELRSFLETHAKADCVEIGFPIPSSIGLGGAVTIGSNDCAHAFAGRLDHQLPTLFLASHIGHQRMQSLYRQEGADSYGLTEREKDCLLWISRGLQTGQIAERPGIAEITVQIHIRKAKAKLETSTRSQAVAGAVVLGLINPGLPPMTGSRC